MVKYIVCDDEKYYPSVEEYDNLNEAKKAYNQRCGWNEDCNTYLCKIIQKQEEGEISNDG